MRYIPVADVIMGKMKDTMNPADVLTVLAKHLQSEGEFQRAVQRIRLVDCMEGSYANMKAKRT